MASLKLQSAMEYLTTYGWSVLVIGVTLLILSGLGVFTTSTSGVSGTCLPQSGFLCSGVTLNTSGYLSGTFGQSSGAAYTVTGVGCTNATSIPASFSSASATLITGQSSKLTFQCPMSSSNIGAPFSGTLWIQFTAAGVAGEVLKVGTVSAKSTTSAPIGTSGTIYNVYVTNYGGENVLIYNTASNALLNSITSGFNEPIGIAIPPTGNGYVVNFLSNNVVLINPATNSVVGAITAGFSEPVGVAIAPSGTYGYITNFLSNNVVVFNTATNAIVSSISGGSFSSPWGVAFAPSGTYAYVAASYSSIAIINTATNAVTSTITSGISGAYGVAFSPSGGYAYVTNGGSNNVVIINTATNAVVGSVAGSTSSATPSWVAFTPSGSSAYIVNYNGNNAMSINTASNAISGSISAGMNNPYGIGFR